jgi:hypothetical protein
MICKKLIDLQSKLSQSNELNKKHAGTIFCHLLLIFVGSS